MIGYRDGILQIDGLAATTVAARYGTPLYVYSQRTLEAAYNSLVSAFAALDLPLSVYYALKANGNPALGRLLLARGAGADVVSGGELYLARYIGFPADRTVFAGVGKTQAEMAAALAPPGIGAFHVESRGELELLATVAAGLGVVAPVAVRVNPDVEAHTHPYITTGVIGSKFGVPPAEALALMRWAAQHDSLQPVGLHAHIGSQLAGVGPIVEATRRLLSLWDTLQSDGIRLTTLDIGGGLAIPYRPDDRPEGPEQLAAGLAPLLRGRSLELGLEPGRYLVGPCGVLLTEVLYMKAAEPGAPRLVIVDAGMTELIRPALYDAYHPIWPVDEPGAGVVPVPTDVAGPVCESADFFAHERLLPPLAPGALLGLGQAGAYGFAMASHYNGRPRPAEVLVKEGEARLIRPREVYAALLPEGG